METQNITLAIPKDVLHKARQTAVARHTSLSGLLTQLLTEIVEQEDHYLIASERQIALLREGLDLNTSGVINWTRDSLHER